VLSGAPRDEGSGAQHARDEGAAALFGGDFGTGAQVTVPAKR
jgi:hypothetical protein